MTERSDLMRLQHLRSGAAASLLAIFAFGCSDSSKAQGEPAPPTETSSTGVTADTHSGAGEAPAAVLDADTKFVIGYSGTPLLPGGKWRVHDPARPHPAAVTPATGVFTPPPSDAIVLFDGKDLSEWKMANEGGSEWVVEGGAMRVPSHAPGTPSADIVTRRSFGDMQLHLEWRAPSAVVSGSQGRGNSGVFLMDRYEVQVLDSYRNVTYADGQASALYGVKPPLINASLPPGEWQSYDMIFEAPRFDDAGKVVSPAYVTVFHNGVLTQMRTAFLGTSTHQKTLPYEKHGPKGPLRLQDHGNPMEFRNIWVRELDLEANE